MKTALTAATAAMILTACGGGGGDEPKAAALECRTVTDTSGGIWTPSGGQVVAASTRTYSLCCAKGFTVLNSPESNVLGNITGASTLNSCAT